ncbi:MAG: phospholipase D-like domain-containing protein [Phycisphaerales bacterium]
MSGDQHVTGSHWPLAFQATPWEHVFLKHVAGAKASLRILCPFIKLRSMRLLLSAIRLPTAGIFNLQVVTRLNKRDCGAFVHDIAALRLLLEAPLGPQCNVELRIDNAIHAKVFICDGRELIVTSSNLTKAAFYTNKEVALEPIPEPV